jgi:hypothetical protein
MGILDIFRFGKVYKLRRKYDRLRERTDKISDREKKVKILRFLDQIEPTLVILEEQNLSRFEKRRMMHYVNNGIKQAKKMLEEKEREEQRAEMQKIQQMQRR